MNGTLDGKLEERRSILVVSRSRAGRMALARGLREKFRVCEAEDVDSAWQSLLQDKAVVAVISEELPLSPGAESLLQRMRSHVLRRIHALPFLLIVPGDDARLAKPVQAHGAGVNGFVSGTMAAAGILGRIQSLLVNPVHHELLPAEVLVQRMSLAFAAAAKHGRNVCALVFGIDNLAALAHESGQPVALAIVARLADVLRNKIGTEDSIGHYPGHCLAIVSCGTELQQCAHFARRVCASLAYGQITMRGTPLHVTASAGIASIQADHPASAEALLVLAGNRWQQALQSGGNAVLALSALAGSEVGKTLPDTPPAPEPAVAADAGAGLTDTATAIPEKGKGSPLLWSDEMATGIEVIDEQHRRIIDYINALGDTAQPQNPAMVGEVLAQLVDYTLSHFAFEEHLLEEAGYPLLRLHRAIHAQFMKRLAKYGERHHAGEDVAVQLHDMLCTWLVHHIQRDDMAYVAELHARLPGAFQDQSTRSWVSRALEKFFK